MILTGNVALETMASRRLGIPEDARIPGSRDHDVYLGRENTWWR